MVMVTRVSLRRQTGFKVSELLNRTAVSIPVKGPHSPEVTSSKSDNGLMHTQILAAEA
ncbi:hypothetical protein HPP92_029068 [Vanilla planifolia]|uniref:Uncharacterized protein n=1 Tax=Vanilla planifolia TaxID=51239 RepID=A0A835P599_VANPL|nr:hypothetical protein HPP92_029057 [Vanilla planifolia]KAG0445981.1 hypothetical protein HPP92_029068 [Vanilla planifolia]